MGSDARTPEALLGRSDSKNPSTTCRGLTVAGKPCRRSLASKKASDKTVLQPGVVALVESPYGRTLDAAYFCWQHKDQAHVATAAASNGQAWAARLVTVAERTSIDSLVERIGVLQLDKTCYPATNDSRRRHDSNQGIASRITATSAAIPERPREKRPPPSQPGPHGFFAKLCCFGGTTDSAPPPPPRRKQTSHPARNDKRGRTAQEAFDPLGRAYSEKVPQCRSTVPPRKPLASLPVQSTNPRLRPHLNDPTASLAQSLGPAALTVIRKELAKPISPHDEDGYIYVFWLTDTATAAHVGTTPGQNLASLNSFMGKRHERKILVKIGRASNVHRRLSEWTQQCGYALSLLRWYPYISSPNTSPTRAHAQQQHIRKVRHVHRVERLIHLELAAQRVKQSCAACKKEHREWFEIDATPAGIKAIDDTIRRWVDWAEPTI